MEVRANDRRAQDTIGRTNFFESILPLSGLRIYKLIGAVAFAIIDERGLSVLARLDDTKMARPIRKSDHPRQIFLINFLGPVGISLNRQQH
jgi:hypothetical protein